jgi:hypothetical protein
VPNNGKGLEIRVSCPNYGEQWRAPGGFGKPGETKLQKGVDGFERSPYMGLTDAVMTVFSFICGVGRQHGRTDGALDEDRVPWLSAL